MPSVKGLLSDQAIVQRCSTSDK